MQNARIALESFVLDSNAREKLFSLKRRYTFNLFSLIYKLPNNDRVHKNFTSRVMSADTVMCTGRGIPYVT